MAFIDSAISLLPPGIPPPLPIFNRISNTARFGMGKAPRGRKGGRSKGGRYFAPKARGEGLTKRQVRPLKKIISETRFIFFHVSCGPWYNFLRRAGFSTLGLPVECDGAECTPEHLLLGRIFPLMVV